MFPEIPVPFLNIGLKSYVVLHGVAYVLFALVGRILTRMHPSLHRHWWRMALLVALADLGVAHLASEVMAGGIAALGDASAWWPFQRGYWGGPMFVAVALGLYAIVFRLPAYPALDVMAICWLIAATFIKTACLLNGCCLGPLCSADWPVAVQGRHPVALYEAAIYLVSAVFLLILAHRAVLRGWLLIVMGLLYGTVQLSIQPVRVASGFYVGQGGVFTVRQAVALAVVAFCASVLVLRFMSRRRIASSSDHHPPSSGSVDSPATG